MITYVYARESTRTQDPKAQVAATGAHGVGLHAAPERALTAGDTSGSPQEAAPARRHVTQGKLGARAKVAGMHGATSDFSWRKLRGGRKIPIGRDRLGGVDTKYALH